MTENPFLNQIKSGKIKTPKQLKKEYRERAKIIHPDITGEQMTGKNFILMLEHYQEALEYLNLFTKQNKSATIYSYQNENDKFGRFNPKERFFKQILLIDMLEDPYFLYPEKRDELIAEAERELFQSFETWHPGRNKLFGEAWIEYRLIKREKPENILENLRIIPLSQDLRVIFYNMAKFVLSKKDVYKFQFERMWKSTIDKMAKRKCPSLQKLLIFLKEDLFF